MKLVVNNGEYKQIGGRVPFLSYKLFYDALQALHTWEHDGKENKTKVLKSRVSDEPEEVLFFSER